MTLKVCFQFERNEEGIGGSVTAVEFDNNADMRELHFKYQYKKVDFLEADSHHRDTIVTSFKNIRSTSSHKIIWRGDDAQFIWDNLPNILFAN